MDDSPETYFQGDEDGGVNLYCARPECMVDWTPRSGKPHKRLYMEMIEKFYVQPSDVVDSYNKHIATHTN
jgi:hypothetical protein